MAKSKIIFECSACGQQQPKWNGRCTACGEWNTLLEKKQSNTSQVASSAFFKGSGVLSSLDDIRVDESRRYDSGFVEVNQVLGGGIVRGAAMLLGGEPGIGKSTLLMQICQKFCHHGTVLYISGEESPSQIKLRAERLGVKGAIEVYTGTDLDAILHTIQQVNPLLLVIDSVQTLYSPEAGLIPGTINQVKRCTHELIGLCKDKGIACFMVAHVTKDGDIAGPKAVEHMVDTVLYFEQGDQELRVLRAVKNRFGAVDELGLFLMESTGLVELNEKQQALLFHRQPPVGSAIACAYEGSRVFFHEIQALTVPAKSGSSRIYSERIDAGRALRIAAVLEKHVGVRFSDQDVYVNVSGGIRLTETGIDLPLALALYSARINTALPNLLVSAGEIALSGEVRPALQMPKRLKGANELNFAYFAGFHQEGLNIKTIASANIRELLKQILLINQ